MLFCTLSRLTRALVTVVMIVTLAFVILGHRRSVDHPGLDAAAGLRGVPPQLGSGSAAGRAIPQAFAAIFEATWAGRCAMAAPRLRW
ncbi:hypothetical protein [Rhodophyticola sp.]|uniref:hypothetical protein n=1 Tax=Rhodophyticola sp. TaxID=2680032 RepID=UPI003D270575